MFNYRIKRFCVWSVFKIVAGMSIICGGFWGLLLGLLEQDILGILGGLFLGFMFGLCGAITSVIYTFLFNLLAPFLGGIEIHLERKNTFVESLEQPIPLADQLHSCQNNPDDPACGKF